MRKIRKRKIKEFLRFNTVIPFAHNNSTRHDKDCMAT